MIDVVVEALPACPLRSALTTAQEAQLVVFASALITIGLADLWAGRLPGRNRARESEVVVGSACYFLN